MSVSRFCAIAFGAVAGYTATYYAINGEATVGLIIFILFLLHIIKDLAE